MVLKYAEGGSFDNLIKRDNGWYDGIYRLRYTIKGLAEIHENKMVHQEIYYLRVNSYLFQIWDCVERLVM